MKPAGPPQRRKPGSFAIAVALTCFSLSDGLVGACRRAPQRTARHGDESETDAALQARLQAALRTKGSTYLPRTRHKNPDGTPKFTNRLILESSPYLLQHAHNPVNWFAWGEEAFQRARDLHRPIFLSVGYSTCHWCHVMEEESFEDEEIARALNDKYVAIKVDREERPDVDAVYMKFVQAFTGNGGWPMSVWITPTLEPFFGGTYFPPRAGVRGADLGFLDVLAAQGQRFAADPVAVTAEARQIAGRLRTATAPEPAGDFPAASVLETARAEAAQSFDPVMGGVRGAPKFPSSFPSRLLLRIARRARDAKALRMALQTLDHMRAGGIYDHLGGGFHRYATDARWLVPHFEKMLYDNAQLALGYLEAGQAAQADPAPPADRSAQAADGRRYLSTTRETLDYLLRDMQAPDGTFYAATDADSATADGRREEGAFFTWTPDELGATLGARDGPLAQAWFAIDAAGPVGGRGVLHTERSATDVARAFGLSPPELEMRVARIRTRLLAQRTRRPPPLRDEKVIVAWNALAISAFARAAIVLGDAGYRDAALRAAGSLIAPVRAGRELPHTIVAGHPRGRAFADDHAFLANALIDVFELTSDPAWLTDAANLMEQLERSFSDTVNGGYYLQAAHHEHLLLRDRPDFDGPIPSVSSVAAMAWLRLLAETGEVRFRERAETTLRAFSRTLASRPLSVDWMLLAVDWATDAVMEIVVVVPEGRGALERAARPLLDVLTRRFVPNSVLVVATPGDLDGELGRRVPWARGKKLRGNQATAYVCERGTCKLPTTDPRVFSQQLAQARPYPR